MPETLNGFHAWPGTPNMGMELQTKAVKANHRLAEEHGARFFFSTRAVQLEQAENGCVTGVYAKDAEGKLGLYRARKGVVLAAGDYSKNADMCRYLLTEAADLTEEGSDFTGHGWDGSGICMGLWAGGRLEPNGQLWAIFDDTIREQVTFQTTCHGLYDYTDEKERANFEAVLAKVKSQSGQTGQKGSAALDKDRAGETRPLYCADTLEELAGLIFKEKEDQENFLKEVKRYNALCRKGHDDDFGKDPRLMHPVEKPPFFASGTIKDSHRPGGQSLKILVTVSGLEIDEHQQVLNRDFEPIPGLYATGNCSGRRFGVQYTTSLPGQSIGIAQTLGRELGLYLTGL